MEFDDLEGLYSKLRPKIEKRLMEFERIWREGDDRRIFAELSFCLLTPQSKARICWNAIENMMGDGTLFEGGYAEILEHLEGIRFKERKASYILKARGLFEEDRSLRIKWILNQMVR